MSTHKRSRGRKDANSDELDAYAESVGIGVIKCSSFAELGFDRIFLYRGDSYIVEYKNPGRRWELTDTECDRRLQCLEHNVPFNVIEWNQQIAAMVGIDYVENAKPRN